MITAFWREARVWPIAGELSEHGFRQLAHDLALLTGHFFLHRGINPLQELVVLFLSERIGKDEVTCQVQTTRSCRDEQPPSYEIRQHTDER